MNRLKEIRKLKGLNQTEVANMLGITQNAYSYWENDKVKIDNNSLKKLADFYNVSVDYLLGRNEISQKEKPASRTLTSYENLAKALDNADLTEIQWEKLSDEDKLLIKQILNRLTK